MMRLIFIASESVPEALPELPDDITEIVLSMPAPSEIVEWALTQDTPVTVVTASVDDLGEDLLESVSEFIEDDEPAIQCAAQSQYGDLAFMAWDGSVPHIAALRVLTGNDVPALDVTDGFQELVLDETPDVDEIVARVTAEVLKVVRAEMQDMFRSRRFRPSGPKV